MLESMTGVARVNRKIAGRHFSFFVRSINHKFGDYHLRYPAVLSSLHEKLTSRLSSTIERGRVEVEISVHPDFKEPRVNESLLKEYLAISGRLTGDKAQVSDANLFGLLKLPGVLDIMESLPKGFPIGEVLAEFDLAILNLKKTREKEGGKIARLLQGYLGKIDKNCTFISRKNNALQKQEVKRFKTDIYPQLKTDLSGREMKLVENSIMEWYGRININEELERLKLHIAAVRDLIKKGGPVGKKIEFFTQELLREANTIASKSTEFTVREKVVEIKNDIENIKEQIRNIC